MGDTSGTINIQCGIQAVLAVLPGARGLDSLGSVDYP
jgi:hypothetical protein